MEHVNIKYTDKRHSQESNSFYLEFGKMVYKASNIEEIEDIQNSITENGIEINFDKNKAGKLMNNYSCEAAISEIPVYLLEKLITIGKEGALKTLSLEIENVVNKCTMLTEMITIYKNRKEIIRKIKSGEIIANIFYYNDNYESERQYIVTDKTIEDVRKIKYFADKEIVRINLGESTNHKIEWIIDCEIEYMPHIFYFEEIDYGYIEI